MTKDGRNELGGTKNMFPTLPESTKLAAQPFFKDVCKLRYCTE